MSRSFVRSWATVVTIMALGCFAFVQPMPKGLLGAEGLGSWGVSAAVEHLTEAPPLVDLVLASKTFSPIAILPAPSEAYVAGNSPAPQPALVAKIPLRVPDPLNRPG